MQAVYCVQDSLSKPLTMAARGGTEGNCPRAPEGGGDKRGRFQPRGDKYDICPRAPETLALPMASSAKNAGYALSGDARKSGI
jgi:hypothetical protein